MPEDALEERLAAVERALEAADGTPAPQEGHTDVAERLDDLEARVTELEAAVQAVRGYVGNVRHVNEAVEQRADAAMAKAQAVERALDAGRPDGPVTSPEATPGDGAQDDEPAATRDAALDPCPRCGGSAGAQRPDPGGRKGDQPRGDDDGRPAGPEGRPTGRSRPPGDGSAGVGHRRLDREDDPDEAGLLARVREVL